MFFKGFINIYILQCIWIGPKAFLHTHVQHEEDVIRGGFYSPELLVASNLSPSEIRTVFGKFEKGHRNLVPQKYIYANEGVAEGLRPTIIRDELWKFVLYGLNLIVMPTLLEAFLHTHIQHDVDIIRGSFYSPELLVVSSLPPYEVSTVFGEFERGHRKQVSQKYIYIKKVAEICAQQSFVTSCQNL